MEKRKGIYKIAVLFILSLMLSGCFKEKTIQADYTAYGTIEAPTTTGPDSPPNKPTGHVNWESPQDSMTLVYVPAGAFLMGPQELNPDNFESNQPQYLVYLDAYWIDQTEVTNLQYARCVMAGACQKPTYSIGVPLVQDYLSNPKYADFPVIGISWYGADAYCRWAGRELPSEARWEKAARGIDGQRYPWGNEEPNGTYANYCDTNCHIEPNIDSVDDGYAFTAPAGSYPAGVSPFGVLDMAGNVAEWVSDWAPDNYDTPPHNTSHGPSTGRLKIFLGGSWMSYEFGLRSSLNFAQLPRVATEVIGFRCAMDAWEGE